jgi:hypothetical protein
MPLSDRKRHNVDTRRNICPHERFHNLTLTQIRLLNRVCVKHKCARLASVPRLPKRNNRYDSEIRLADAKSEAVGGMATADENSR